MLLYYNLKECFVLSLEKKNDEDECELKWEVFRGDQPIAMLLLRLFCFMRKKFDEL